MALDPESLFNPGTIQEALDWERVANEPPGQARFRAARALLRERLKDVGRAPSAAKGFLSENLIRTAGKSGKVSDLPRALRRVLGSKPTQKAFVNELQTAYMFTANKMPKGLSKRAFEASLKMLKQGGAPDDLITKLRRIGPQKIAKHGGFGPAVAAVRDAAKGGPISRAMRWATETMGMKTRKTPPVPVALEEVAAGVRPAPALQKAAKSASRAGGKQVLSAIGKGAGSAAWRYGLPLALSALSIKELIGSGEEEEAQAAQMALTGAVPQELGGDALTSGAFMQMMVDRGNALKAARFNAMTQQRDLTREVLAAISGEADRAPNVTNRVKLGQAREQPASRMGEEEVALRFNEFLKQVTGA